MRLLVLAALVAACLAACDSSKPRKPQVQQISLVKPPLPPKLEKPPEEKKEEVKQDIPPPEDVKDDSPPPAEDLGLDAKGVAGSDGFGLAGRPGGRDITTIGATGTGTGAGRAFYANQLQSELQDALNRDDKLRSAQYRARVSLWLSAEGNVTKVEIAGSTGDADLDRLLQATLAKARRLKPPPEGLAQPIRVELVARRT